MRTSIAIRQEQSVQTSPTVEPVFTTGADRLDGEQSEHRLAASPDQLREQSSPAKKRYFFVRAAAAVGLLFYIISAPLDSPAVTVLRWSLLCFIAWYGWWEASLCFAGWRATVEEEKLSEWFNKQREMEQMKRIRLLLQTPEHLRTLLEGADGYQGRFHVAVAQGVREFIAGPEVSPEFIARLNQSAPADPWKDGFAVLEKEENTIIGLSGFAGPPAADGTVEIAYGIAPGYQNRGYAKEVAEELIAYAFASGRVQKVCAHTLPENNPSTRVLTKCGFSFVGEVDHAEDGIVWRWEKALG